jgi:hypothetical protein
MRARLTGTRSTAAPARRCTACPERWASSRCCPATPRTAAEVRLSSLCVLRTVQSVVEWPRVWRSGIVTSVSCHVVCLLRTRHKCGSQSSCLPHLGDSYMMLYHDSCAVLLNLRVFPCSAEAGTAHPEATQALRRKVSHRYNCARIFLFCACVYTLRIVLFMAMLPDLPVVNPGYHWQVGVVIVTLHRGGVCRLNGTYMDV